MGVPTIKRDRSSYLFETLQSILDGLNEEEKDDCLIVVMVSEVSIVLSLKPVYHIT